MKIRISLLFVLCLCSLSSLFAQQLRIDKEKRILEKEDGTPFLWIGDTAWELFHVLNREEAVYYLDNRKEKGFSVIQAVVLSELQGISTPNAYGELPLTDKNPEKPNEKYFQHVDFIVREAKKRGLYIGMLPTWGDKVTNAHGGEGVIFTPENAYVYGKFLGNRYKSSPVIWILGGDRNIDSDLELEIWNEMARGIKEGDGGTHLMTYHPRGESSSAYWLHNMPWLDFNSYQSGHGRRYDKVYEYNEYHRLLFPRKPFMNAEPAYEDIGVRFSDFMNFEKNGKDRDQFVYSDGLIKDPSFFQEGIFDAYDVRVSAYWTLLSGAAGYTYGNNAIWQMFKPNGRCAIPAVSYWTEALDRPGAQSMLFLRKIFELFPLGSFYPDQSLIFGINPENDSYIVSAITDNQKSVLVYLSKGQPVRLNLSKMSGNTPMFRWYNPSTGEFSVKKQVEVDNNSLASFEAPTKGLNNDWLLVIECD